MKIAKLFEISKLFWISILIGIPPNVFVYISFKYSLQDALYMEFNYPNYNYENVYKRQVSYHMHANQCATTKKKPNIKNNRAKLDSKKRCNALATRPNLNSLITCKKVNVIELNSSVNIFIIV